MAIRPEPLCCAYWDATAYAYCAVAEPSHADQLLTQSLKQALALVDVKVLDHFIVTGSAALSFAERGLL